MRTDPRAACANEQQRLGWAILHDLVAHPLMVLTGRSRPALRFHDWTSYLAWPRRAVAEGEISNRTFPGAAAAVTVSVPHVRFGVLKVTAVAPAGFYSVLHGRFSHAVVVKAAGVADAVQQAEAWFETLVELIPHSAASQCEMRLMRGGWRP